MAEDGCWLHSAVGTNRMVAAQEMDSTEARPAQVGIMEHESDMGLQKPHCSTNAPQQAKNMVDRHGQEHKSQDSWYALLEDHFSNLVGLEASHESDVQFRQQFEQEHDLWKERVDAGIEEGENEGDLGFIPSARAGQARGPAETIDKDLEEVGQEQSGERQDMEELGEDHCEDDDDLENLGFTPPARQLAQPSPQTQNKTGPQILTTAENNDNVGDGHDVFDFVDEDEKDKAEKDKSLGAAYSAS